MVKLGLQGPQRCFALLQGSAKEMASAMLIFYLLCQGYTSVHLNCPKKGNTLNLRPESPLPALNPSPLPAPPLLQVRVPPLGPPSP